MLTLTAPTHDEPQASPTDTAPPDRAPGGGRDPRALLHYLAPIAPYLADPRITEIAINRPGELWTEESTGWQRHAASALTLECCRFLASLVATYDHKHVDERTPTLSATLPAGERIEIVLPPACEPGTVSFTIRKPAQIRRTLDQHETEGAFDAIVDIARADRTLNPLEDELLALKAARRWREFLALAVRSRRNIVLSGATGSGKTTLLKSLLDCIPATERLVTIEDVAEITLPRQPNHVHLYYSKDGQGSARVTAKQLLAASLRMKPTRILLAELRADEAFMFLDAANTGHPGSMTTVHANSAKLAFARIASLIGQAPEAANRRFADILAEVQAKIDIVIQCEEVANAHEGRSTTTRRITEIYYAPLAQRRLAAE